MATTWTSLEDERGWQTEFGQRGIGEDNCFGRTGEYCDWMSDSSEREWPHDPDGKHGSQGKRSFDLAILSRMAPKDDFPIETSAFLEEYGDWPVRINHETVVSVAEIFENVERDRFEDKQEFHAAVGDAMRASGLWKYHVED
ncbi:MAG: DUF5785 family protein [Halodesulfurarchaeum sp.]